MKEEKHQFSASGAGLESAVALLVLLRALVAACTLRDVLDQNERVCSLQLSAAMGQLVLECEQLISDRECLIPLALLRQRVEAFVGEERAAKTADRPFAWSPAGQGLLRFAQHALSRLIARLWALLDIERLACSNVSQAARA